MRISFRFGLSNVYIQFSKGVEGGPLLLLLLLLYFVWQVSQPAAELSGSQVQPKGGGIQVFCLVLDSCSCLMRWHVCLSTYTNSSKQQQLLPANLLKRGERVVGRSQQTVDCRHCSSPAGASAGAWQYFIAHGLLLN